MNWFLAAAGGGFSNIIVSKPGSMLLDFMEPVPTIPELLNDPSLRSDPAILSYAFAEIARAIGQHHIALMPDFFRPNKFTEIRLDGDQGWYQNGIFTSALFKMRLFTRSIEHY